MRDGAGGLPRLGLGLSALDFRLSVLARGLGDCEGGPSKLRLGGDFQARRRARTPFPTAGGTPATSHHWGHCNPKHVQGTNQFPSHDHGSREQEALSAFVSLVQDWMPVVESVEQLGQLEDMFCKIR